MPLPTTASSALTIGVRAPARCACSSAPATWPCPGTVELAEISGSDTFVHAATPVGELVAQLTGVHQFELGAPVTLFLNPAQVCVFDANGELLGHLRLPAV